MGNKQNKGASSTELTAKRNNLCHRLHLFKPKSIVFFRNCYAQSKHKIQRKR